jgi:beta-glucosidase
LFDGVAPSGLDTGCHTLYLDPILLGASAEWGERHFGDAWLQYTEEDLAVIAQPLDFLGLNCYSAVPVCTGANGMPELAPFTPEKRTHFNWPVTPDALYWNVKLFYERYRRPILITENGMSNDDSVSDDGRVHDKARIDFLRDYLRELRRTADEGVPLLGYLQWSLLDNFEWAEGYAQRFGLIHVNYQTQKHTLKDSALWYKEVTASNGANL